MARKDQVVGTVTITDDGATGRVELTGEQRTFTTEPATGRAGAYRKAIEDPARPWDWWVVLNDGTYTGTSKGKPIGKPDNDPGPSL